MNRWKRTAGIAAVFVALFTAAKAVADDWPQWRGPNRDGISKETGLLHQWPAEGPKLLWQARDAGAGFSTPAVVGERLYFLGNRGLEEEFVAAKNASDGKTVWSVKIGRVGNPNQQPSYPGARSTPTVDGEALYALGSDGDLVCLAIADGGVRWSKNLRRDYGGKAGRWAYAESPLVDGDVLACTPGGERATLVALNKKSGEPIWKCAVPGGDEAGYASIVIDDVEGTKQYVQFLQKGLTGVDAKTGKVLWRYEQTAQGSAANIPTPVVKGSLVYSAAGQSGGGLVRLAVKTDSVAAEQVYFDRNLPNAIGGSILLGDWLYGTGRAGMQCVEFATGKSKWQEKGIGVASLCFADGCLYLHGEDGDVALVEATPDGYRQKGRFSPPDQPQRGTAKAWAYPVVANGRLYVRDGESIWCYDAK